MTWFPTPGRSPHLPASQYPAALSTRVCWYTHLGGYSSQPPGILQWYTRASDLVLHTLQAPTPCSSPEPRRAAPPPHSPVGILTSRRYTEPSHLVYSSGILNEVTWFPTPGRHPHQAAPQFPAAAPSPVCWYTHPARGKLEPATWYTPAVYTGK